MHKTEKTAKESRMNLMYNHLCDRTLEGVPLEPYQSLWLEIQIRELGVKKAVVIWEALREWVSRYSNLDFPPGTPPNVVAKALEEFMARREEFLPLKG